MSIYKLVSLGTRVKDSRSTLLDRNDSFLHVCNLFLIPGVSCKYLIKRSEDLKSPSSFFPFRITCAALAGAVKHTRQSVRSKLLPTVNILYFKIL